MLLSLSHPHDHLSIKRRTGRIPLWSMDLSSRLRVHTEAAVDGGGIAVRLGWVIRVVGGLRRGRFALMGQGPSHELVARSASMYVELRKNSKLITNYVELSVTTKK